MKQLPNLLSLKELAELIRVRTETIMRWEKKGIIKSIRKGANKKRFFTKEDILDFLKNGISKSYRK